MGIMINVIFPFRFPLHWNRIVLPMSL
jgi:hypothetical protein